MLHQYINASKTPSIHEIVVFVSGIESQKDLNKVKESLLGAKGLEGVFTVTCDKRQDKLVRVKFSASQDKKAFSQSILDTLERKGYKGNEIREIALDATTHARSYKKK